MVITKRGVGARFPEIVRAAYGHGSQLSTSLCLVLARTLPDFKRRRSFRRPSETTPFPPWATSCTPLRSDADCRSSISTMPKYYCDYCDKFLTHDSPSVLFVSTTRSGWRSRYKSWLIMPVSFNIYKLILLAEAYKQGKVPPPMFGAAMGIPPPGIPGPGMPAYPPRFPPLMSVPPLGMKPPLMPPQGLVPGIRIPPGAPMPPTWTPGAAGMPSVPAGGTPIPSANLPAPGMPPMMPAPGVPQIGPTP
ncbi:hypothetical protein SprV_0200656500 [Sparganum proliferum]